MQGKKYSSVIIDVVDSKKYENRAEIQMFLKQIMQYMNEVFQRSIKKPLMFSAGDEIQGLFSSTIAAYLCARFFMMICFPVKVRIGIGNGTLAFDYDGWSSSELDGEVYHTARFAIDSFVGKSSFGIRINSQTKADKFVNSLLYSAQIIQRNQTFRVQDTKLMAELIFPIYDEKIMEPYLESKGPLQIILDYRRDISMYRREAFSSFEHQERTKPGLDVVGHTIENYNISISDIVNSNDIMIENTWKKGMSTMISNSMGTTRQNIDQHIRLGKIEENRMIDFSIAAWILEVLTNE